MALLDGAYISPKSNASSKLKTCIRWLGGQSLEHLHSGLSLIVCLGVGPVGVGLDLHIEDLVFGSRDLSVIIPVNENEKVFVFGSILLPGLLIGPFLF